MQNESANAVTSVEEGGEAVDAGVAVSHSAESALKVILEAKGLGKVKLAENLYRVAPKATLEKEQQMKIKELQHKQVLKPLITKIIPANPVRIGAPLVASAQKSARPSASGSCATRTRTASPLPVPPIFISTPASA